uniref:NADH dehydrogenase subunit 6 n=1 Tax=Satsuma myomphala TaxID=358001 RepID=UPI003003197E
MSILALYSLTFGLFTALFLGAFVWSKSTGGLLLPLLGFLSLMIVLCYHMFNCIMSLFLFMVYVGGILVMFIYAMIFSSNYKFTWGSLTPLLGFLPFGLYGSYVLDSGTGVGSILAEGFGNLLGMDYLMVGLMGLMLLFVFVYLYSLLSGGAGVLSAIKI